MTTTDHRGSRTSGRSNRAKEQRAWYWYDWANSAFYTTVLTVLFAPYMITVAGRAAGCVDRRDEDLHQDRQRPRASTSPPARCRST